MKNLFLIVFLLFIAKLSHSQISYEDYQKYYEPNYDTLVWEDGPTQEEANYINSLTPQEIADSATKAYEAGYEARGNMIDVLLCINRTKMRDAFHLMSIKVSINLISIMTDKWEQEIMWFLNKHAYTALAPAISGTRNFTPEEGDYTLLKDTYTDLEKGINTSYKEINPFISPDGKTLMFSRMYHPLNNFGKYATQDIWVADIENGFDDAIATHMDYPFNQRYRNGVSGISPDGKTIFIEGRYVNGKYKSHGISIIRKTIDGYSDPKGYKIIDFDEINKGKYMGFHIHSDLKTLFMYCTPEKGSGNTNIYVSFKENDSTFSKPLPLGPQINHDDSQQSTAFLASDGKTLYFASNHSGFGSSDIFMTKRQDDSWTNWSEPVNLGEKINTKGFEAYYSIDAKGEYAYMVRQSSKERREDIVKIPLEKEFQPDPVVLISGKVFNAKTNEPLSAEIEYVGLDDGVSYGSTYSDPKNGSYLIVLPYGKKYAFNAKADNFVAITDNIDLVKAGEHDMIERDLSLVPIEVGQKVRMNNIFFDLNKSSLQSASYIELKKIAELLKSNTSMQIEISGHTDNTGKAAYNMSLSEKRAKAVYDYLLKEGVAAAQLEFKGMGITAPVASNETEEGRAKNRRVEFEILKVN